MMDRDGPAMLPKHALKLVLVEPEIPQNTGNIARLCAATGVELHLVRPLGFILSDRHFKRAGMDYVRNVAMKVHEDLAGLFASVGNEPFFLTSGLSLVPAAREYWSVRYGAAGWILFGKESAGLPAPLLGAHAESVIQIPMVSGTRGLNVSTAAGIVLYEALRQLSLSVTAGSIS
jgi:tRNA (cytidine/uridine-2'-O-)-methyltransferase